MTNQADYDIIIIVKFNSYRFGYDFYASFIGRISIVLDQNNYIFVVCRSCILDKETRRQIVSLVDFYSLMARI